MQADDELYFGINRVVGGTYRPGIGLCRAKITWLQCLSQVKRNESDVDPTMFVDWASIPRSLELTELAFYFSFVGFIFLFKIFFKVGKNS